MNDAITQLAYDYAKAIDTVNLDAVCAVFTKDGRLSGPGFDFTGRDGLKQMLQQVDASFAMTQHRVFNNRVDIDVDTATGETYSEACHIIANEDGTWLNHKWAIRYQNSYVKQNDVWLYSARKLIVDWTENSPASPLTLGER